MNIQQEFEKLDLQKALGIGLLVAGAYWVLFYDGGKSFEAQRQVLTTTLNQNNQRLASIREAVENQKKFEQEIKEINQNIKDFEAFFEKNVDQNDLQARVSKFAEESGIVLNKLLMAESRVSEFPNYKETAVTFEVEGSFHNVMEFISRLTQMNRAIDFSTLEFKTVVPGDFPMVAMTTTLVVYSSQAPESDGSSAAPGSGGGGV